MGTAEVVQAGEVRSARIESLRALAALSVLVFHVVQLTTGPFARFGQAGRLGVYLFFTLSGYLLFMPFARQIYAGGRRVDVARYARNRALRILPLYFAVLAIVLVLGHGGGSPSQWAKFGTMTQSFFSNTVLNDVDGPMWSLAVELQFYVLLPLFAFVLAAVARTPARAAAVVLAVAAASVAVWGLKVYGQWPGAARWGYSLPANLYAFGPGMLLALVRLELDRRPELRLPRSTVLIGAAVAVWIAAAYLNDLGSIIAAPASFLLLAAVVLPVRDGAAARVLDLRALTAVGIASYSLYLWHSPVIRWLGHHIHTSVGGLLVLSLAVCIPLALASYAVVERPFLRLRGRWGSTVAEQEATGPVTSDEMDEAAPAASRGAARSHLGAA